MADAHRTAPASARTKVPKHRFTVRGLAATRPLRETRPPELFKAMRKAGMKFKNGSHVAGRIIKYCPKEGIETLEILVRALGRARPVHGEHHGSPHFYFRLRGRIWMVMNARGQFTTVRFTPPQAPRR